MKTVKISSDLRWNSIFFACCTFSTSKSVFNNRGRKPYCIIYSKARKYVDSCSANEPPPPLARIVSSPTANVQVIMGFTIMLIGLTHDALLYHKLLVCVPARVSLLADRNPIDRATVKTA